MPAPSKIAALPPKVREELHLRVIHSGFSDYEGHAEWLKSQGHDISHAAVWRYFRAVREETQKELTALAVSSQTTGLYAALARETGEDFSLATEYMVQARTLQEFRAALDSGEITLEHLLDFQKLSASQRLTRLRAARERRLRGAPGDDAAPAAATDADEADGKPRPATEDTLAAVRAAIQGEAA